MIFIRCIEQFRTSLVKPVMCQVNMWKAEYTSFSLAQVWIWKENYKAGIYRSIRDFISAPLVPDGACLNYPFYQTNRGHYLRRVEWSAEIPTHMAKETDPPAGPEIQCPGGKFDRWLAMEVLIRHLTWPMHHICRCTSGGGKCTLVILYRLKEMLVHQL